MCISTLYNCNCKLLRTDVEQCSHRICRKCIHSEEFKNNFPPFLRSIFSRDILGHLGDSEHDVIFFNWTLQIAKRGS